MQTLRSFSLQLRPVTSVTKTQTEIRERLRAITSSQPAARRLSNCAQITYANTSDSFIASNLTWDEPAPQIFQQINVPRSFYKVWIHILRHSISSTAVIS